MTGGEGSILVVDDEMLIAMGLSAVLEELGYSVCGTAATATQAVKLAEMHKPKLVLMDVRLKGQADGVDAALEIHRLLKTPVIFITGSQEPETVARIQQDHPAAVLFKPIFFDQLKTTIEQVLQQGGS